MELTRLRNITFESLYNKLYWTAGVFFAYANGSLISENYRNLFNISVVLMLFILVMFNTVKTKKIVCPNPLILFFTFFPVLSLIFHADESINVVSIFFTLSVYFLLGLLSKKDIYTLLEKYAFIIYYLAIISIPLSIIFLIDYSLLSRFIPLSPSGVGPIYNLIVYTERVVNDMRVQSIYWEPGAWAVNLGFCLYWFCFVKKESKKVLIIMISMIPVFSTSGFGLLGVTLIACVFYASYLINAKSIATFITICVIIVAGIAYSFYSLDLDIIGIVEEQTISKLTEDPSGSYSARKETTQDAFKLAVENPIIGVGKQNFENSLFVTSAIAEIAYQMGIIFLLTYMFIFLLFFRKMGLILGSVFALIMLNAEAYAFHILFSLILIYNSKSIWSLILQSLKIKKNE